MKKLQRIVSRSSAGEADDATDQNRPLRSQRPSIEQAVVSSEPGSPQPLVTGSPSQRPPSRKKSSGSSFGSFLEDLRSRANSLAKKDKPSDILDKPVTNKFNKFWEGVEATVQSAVKTTFYLPEHTYPQVSAMDTSMLVPGGPDRRKQIQDAKDMYQTIVRNAERSGSAVPPYQFLELIGKGSFGRVYKCLDKTNNLVAVKIVNIDEMDFAADLRDRDETVKDFRKEVGILQQLKDSGARNVNLIHEAFDLHSQLWIISDYCTGGSVRTLMRANPTPKLEERFIIPIARELAVAMKCVHDIEVIHRDIKCTNVYVTEDGQIQLGDFGIVGVMEGGASKRTTIIGTPWYMPREMHVDGLVAQGYGTEVDIWSYGCTIYEMATGTVPNAGVHMHMLSAALESAPRLEGDEYSEGLRDFVAFCLNSDPRARPTSEQVLNHPYIAGTEDSHPTYGLIAMIERYAAWEFKGGQRTSLFNPGGAAAPMGAADVEDDYEDTEDWNFSTSASFNQEFGRRYSQMMLYGPDGMSFDEPVEAGLPQLQTKGLTIAEQIQQEHKEKSATRGEMSLDRLFNTGAAPYAMHPELANAPTSPPAEDVPSLPLRNSAEGSSIRESTIMIDLDASPGYTTGPNFNFDFEDVPTLKAKGRRSYPDDDNDDEQNEDEEDDYQYHSEDAGGDKRATVDWKFPGAPAPAPAASSSLVTATAPKRATMAWTFATAQPAEADEADATMNLPPPGDGGPVAPGFRPQLLHSATAPVGQFGDYLQANQAPAATSPAANEFSRDSVQSMIDLDLAFSDPTDLPPRPSTAASTADSTGTNQTSGDPFDLEERPEQPAPDANRLSYHKQWQSDGGPSDSNRGSLRNMPMHARGSSLSSTASEMERNVQVPAAAEDVFAGDFDDPPDNVNRHVMQMTVPHSAPLGSQTDWPDFNRDYTDNSPAFPSDHVPQSSDSDYLPAGNDRLNGVQGAAARSGLMSQSREQETLEFPNVNPPNPAVLDEDASAEALAAELERMLDDMGDALESTGRAMRQRAGISGEHGYSSVEEETDGGFESSGSYEGF